MTNLAGSPEHSVIQNGLLVSFENGWSLRRIPARNLILWMPIKLLVQGSIFIKSNQFATLDFSMKILPFLLLLAAFLSLISTAHSSYTVVVSSRTHNDKHWKPVVEVLVEKHGAQVVEYGTSVNESLTSYASSFPDILVLLRNWMRLPRSSSQRYISLLVSSMMIPTPILFGALLLATMPRMPLKLLVTRSHSPLRRWHPARKSLWNVVPSGLWYDELVKNKYVRKKSVVR